MPGLFIAVYSAVGFSIYFALGVVAGWHGGSALASALLGLPWTAGRDAWAALAVTLAAGIAGTWFFWSRHRAAELERGRKEDAIATLHFLDRRAPPARVGWDTGEGAALLRRVRAAAKNAGPAHPGKAREIRQIRAPMG